MAEPPADALETTPSRARIYDYILGGFHNVAADRAVAEALIRQDPDFPLTVRANRAFLTRVVRFLADAGIDQYLDLGSGMPTAGTVHEVAQELQPDAHVVYVELDPVAVQYGQAILQDQPTVCIVEADVFAPGAVLRHPEVRRLLDWTRPLAVLLLSVLHFLPEEERAGEVVRVYREALPAGSYLALSHATRWLPHSASAGTSRTPAEVAAYFAGLEMVEPGLVYTPLWRPESADELLVSEPERSMTVGGVGRTPLAGPGRVGA